MVERKNTHMVTVFQYLCTSCRNSGDFTQHCIHKQVTALMVCDSQLCKQIANSSALREREVQPGNMPASGFTGDFAVQIHLYLYVFHLLFVFQIDPVFYNVKVESDLGSPEKSTKVRSDPTGLQLTWRRTSCT